MTKTKNLSKGEKYDRQKTLNAERVKRFRQNMTEDQWEEKRRKDRERYKKKKEQNLIKSINELSEREKRKKRKMWKQNSKNYRSKKKNEENALASTPPPSDEEIRHAPVESVQKKRGRKQVKRDRSKSYRLVQKQKKTIEGLERLVKKYQKRLERVETKPSIESPSPNKKVRMLLGTEKVSPLVKRRLFAGYALEKQLKNIKKKTSPGSKRRQLVRKIIGTKILRKYRVQKYFSNILSYKSNKLDESNLNYTRKTHIAQSKVKINNKLQLFFQEDNVSKMCPGKRDYVKKGKLKVQRRILLDSLKNLHKRFMEENCCKISYSKFARARPFWVTYPNARDRDTCACDIHSNMDFMVLGLNNIKAIKERTGKAALESIVCSIYNEECMTNQCKICKDKDICFVEEMDENINVKIYKWKSVSEKRVIKNQVKLVKRMIKHREVMKLKEAKDRLKSMMVLFKRHVYYVIHQSQHKIDVKKQLTGRELMLMIDFSENYSAKYESEVQAMHFGASKKQITLHTVVCYYNDGEQILPRSFCTVSDHLAHQAHAVWAHLDPILQLLSKDFPQTSVVHIFSDSPSSQYRNRTNLWLLKKLFTERYFPLLKGVIWNYSEKGHGKGPMDGIGGTLKRRADDLVLHGHDITKASDFVKQFKNGKITVLEVSEKEVESIKKLVPSIIAPVQQITKMKQITFCLDEGQMSGRALSCFKCPFNKKCYHFKTTDIFAQTAKSKIPLAVKPKLQVENVWSSDDEIEDLPGASSCSLSVPGTSSARPPTETFINDYDIQVNDYLLVKYESSNSRVHQFVGICQEKIYTEMKVLFLKLVNNANKDLFMVNESDISFVSKSQVMAVLPPPDLVMKGDRVFYKFKYSVNVF